MTHCSLILIILWHMFTDSIVVLYVVFVAPSVQINGKQQQQQQKAKVDSVSLPFD